VFFRTVDGLPAWLAGGRESGSFANAFRTLLREETDEPRRASPGASDIRGDDARLLGTRSRAV